ncbi:hypothetical protein E3P99_02973 [Wallemia hederae]|uniref:3-phytase n=1 Tax=Wallemia hederae TaxID=1540922 RepID=A0A4T0FHR9_9BASI|nr:hypothetical protein E3P99_02973 [Wallemia hederae]
MKTSVLLAVIATLASTQAKPLNERATAVVAGSATSDSIPWPTDDGYDESLYRLDQGHRGPTPTGIEPAAIQTAPAGYYPYVKEPSAPVVKPRARDAKSVDEFDVTSHWGVLTPYRSAPAILKDASPLPPPQCSVNGINVVHRHGARYPTASANPAKFASKLEEAVKTQQDANAAIQFNDELEFLADWTYKLGSAILTPIGRTEESDSGSAFRTKYGYLLKDIKAHKPIFRTTTQDRMFNSAIEFLAGFFGVENWQDRAHLVQIIEEEGHFNNTLNPSQTCEQEAADQGDKLKEEWYNHYLQDALTRLNAQAVNFDFTIDDVYALQDICAYETVALGYSEFCSLFTKDEWRGYEYAADLTNYGDDSFGSPLARARGLGWVQELLYRLSGQVSALEKQSTINTTLAYDQHTLPIDQTINIDFSHDVVLANILTTLNLTHLATPLPTDAIQSYSPEHLRWVTSNLTPFGSNIVIQSLECAGEQSGQYNRIVINDAVHPLTGINGCEDNKYGLCSRDAFVGGLQQIIQEVDFNGACYGDVENKLVAHGVPEW